MKKNLSLKRLAKPKAPKQKETNAEGYPVYPAADDVYRRFRNNSSLHPETTPHVYIPSRLEELNEKSFEDDMSGADLDIPGTELDDEQEAIGAEDEENNYYSLGDDN